jgi:hypothetical protein
VSPGKDGGRMHFSYRRSGQRISRAETIQGNSSVFVSSCLPRSSQSATHAFVWRRNETPS